MVSNVGPKHTSGILNMSFRYRLVENNPGSPKLYNLKKKLKIIGSKFDNYE